MKILALDTSTDACSVALLNDQQIIEEFTIVPQKHSQLILTMIDKILAQGEYSLTQIDAIAFGRGPGSFTGIRIAASVVQALAFGLDLPVIPISTLHALAQGATREFNALSVMAMIDARMNEVYWATYQCNEKGIMHTVIKEAIDKPEKINLAKHQAPVTVIGSGWLVYETILLSHYKKQIKEGYPYLPHAYDIAYLAKNAVNPIDYVKPEDALPLYLRNDVVQAPTR
ncbi:MAG: tRNA threonylcarbamoyladenosine biosynthesis protein TsaB [Legionellaceae bacterium]